MAPKGRGLSPAGMAVTCVSGSIPDCFSIVQTNRASVLSKRPSNKHIYSYAVLLPRCRLHVPMDVFADFYT